MSRTPTVNRIAGDTHCSITMQQIASLTCLEAVPPKTTPPHAALRLTFDRDHADFESSCPACCCCAQSRAQQCRRSTLAWLGQPLPGTCKCENNQHVAADCNGYRVQLSTCHLCCISAEQPNAHSTLNSMHTRRCATLSCTHFPNSYMPGTVDANA